MSKRGWIKTYRNIQDHWLWTTEKPFDQRSAWLDIVLRANHETQKIPSGDGIEIVERGSFVTSIVKLAEAWGWSRQTTMRFLDLLESDNMIVRKSDNRRTAVFVVNYELYQKNGTPKRTANDTAKKEPETLINQGETQDQATPSGQQNGQQSGQQMDNRWTTDGHKQEYIKNNKEYKEKENKEKAAVGADPFYRDGPPPKGTPEYDRWRNQ